MASRSARRVRWVWWLAAFLLAAGAAGCWDYREVDRLAFVTVLGLDAASQGGDVHVSCLFSIPTGGGGGGGVAGGGGGGGAAGAMPTLMEASSGMSVGDALLRLNRFTGRSISLSHTRAVIFGEQLAKRGIEPYLDILTRWYEFGRTMAVFVARPAAEKVMNIESPLVRDPAEFVMGLAEGSPALGFAGPVRLQDVLLNLQSFRTEVVLPLLEPVSGPHMHVGPGAGGQGRGGRPDGDTTPAVALAGLAVFRRDRMVGTLDPAETIHWLLLTGQLNRTFLTFHDPRSPRHHVVVSLNDASRRVKAGSRSRPSLDVAVQMGGIIQEIESGKDYSTDEGRELLERHVARELQRALTRLVRRAQREFRADIFRFGDAYATRFLFWDDWLHYNWAWRRFPEAQVRVSVRVKLVRPGVTLNPVRPAR